MKQKTQQESVRFVQFLLNPHLINRFLAFAALISPFACASSVESTEDRPVTLFAEYPIAAESLGSARPFLLKGDGEGLYGLALKNEAALKQRLDAEAQSNRGTFCEGCGDSCRHTLQQRMKGLTDERNQAQMKLLRLRLDALQFRLEEFHRKQDIKSDLAEFTRHRLLVESVAAQRLESIQDYYLKALTACTDIAAPKDHWFLPYYTAYFKLSRILPESVRSYL